MTTYAAQRARLAAEATPAPVGRGVYAAARARNAAQPRRTPLRYLVARAARLDRRVAEIAARVPFAK